MARLSVNQKTLLIALARSGRDIKPTSGDFIKKYHLSSASSVQRSLAALQEKDIVTSSANRLCISSVLAANNAWHKNGRAQ